MNTNRVQKFNSHTRNENVFGNPGALLTVWDIFECFDWTKPVLSEEWNIHGKRSFSTNTYAKLTFSEDKSPWLPHPQHTLTTVHICWVRWGCSLPSTEHCTEKWQRKLFCDHTVVFYFVYYQLRFPKLVTVHWKRIRPNNFIISFLLSGMWKVFISLLQGRLD